MANNDAVIQIVIVINCTTTTSTQEINSLVQFCNSNPGTNYSGIPGYRVPGIKAGCTLMENGFLLLCIILGSNSTICNNTVVSITSYNLLL